jgi:hypothetical protein
MEQETTANNLQVNTLEATLKALEIAKESGIKQDPEKYDPEKTKEMLRKMFPNLNLPK